ncbi:MAG TPA: CRTAC1 family protein, partial [Polyangiaceae bacterium]|nr:CRTAC1 family protein [Polyangiaceae bacterium]
WSTFRRSIALALISCPALLKAQTAPPASAVRFVDATQSANIDVAHSFPEVPGSLTQRATGGVAIGDYDADGLLDLFVAAGKGRASALLRNRGDGTFEEAAALAGVAVEGVNDAGPLFFDYDGDGYADLFLGATEGDPPLLFRNQQDGTFRDVTSESGFAALGGTVSATAADYDGDGFLDLFLSHWGEVRSTCHLFRNLRGKAFECMDQAAGIESFSRGGVDTTFTANFADLNHDGQPDLLVAADFGTSRVLLNRGDGTFRARQSSVISDENGMGAALGDYDGDGAVDWFVSGIFDVDGVAEGDWGTSGNRLYRGLGDGNFVDATDVAGVREGDWGWSSSFADLDNDGVLDLVQETGWQQGAPQFRGTRARLFMGSAEGVFTEQAESAGFDERDNGRGLVVFDYDLDGDLDLVVMNNSGPLRLWRNETGSEHGNHLSVVLVGQPPNPSAIGATISLRAGDRVQSRLIRAGSNYASQDPAVAHFGLGSASSVSELRVHWPDGSETTRRDLPANRQLTLQQPAATPPPSPGCSFAP